MHHNLEKFENTSLYLPFRLPSIRTGVFLHRNWSPETRNLEPVGEMAGVDHACSQVSLSSSKRENHGNDVRCGRLTTELTMATRPRAQVNDLRMLYWLLKTATGSRFQTARPEK